MNKSRCLAFLHQTPAKTGRNDNICTKSYCRQWCCKQEYIFGHQISTLPIFCALKKIRKECKTTIQVLSFLSSNLLIGWQLSIWNCRKPHFSLLYNCQLMCFWRLALSIVVEVFPRPFFRVLLLQGCLLQSKTTTQTLWIIKRLAEEA